MLTAAHVGGRPHQRATVVLNDGTELPAEVLGMNRNVDAGLLKIVDTRARFYRSPPLATVAHCAKASWYLELVIPVAGKAAEDLCCEQAELSK